MITLHQLKVFVAVAEFGGTAAAARALHLSQPAVSLIIQALEKELGVKLFIRSPPKGLSISSFGRSRLESARSLLTSAKLFNESQDAGQQLHGQINLGYFTTLGPSYVPRLVRRLRDSLPNVEVCLREGDLSSINRMLETGQVELALTFDLGLAERLRVNILQERQFYAALPPDHPLTQRDTVSLEELAAEDYIQIDLPYSREFLMSPFWHYKLEPIIAYKANSLEMVLNLIANGLGVSLLITRPEDSLTCDGSMIACRPVSDPLPTQKLVLAHSNEFALSPIARTVMEETMMLFGSTDTVNSH